MEFDGYSLRTQDYDNAVEAAEEALGLSLDRAGAVYGTQGATVGFPSSRGTWVHLAWRAPDWAGAGWTGVELASAIAEVRKPRLFRSYRWLDEARQVVWRADETELIGSAAVHGTGVITSEPDLPAGWWADLGSSLSALAKHETTRTTMSQDHLAKRINQVFGDRELDTTISQWATVHGDLPWGNVTAPACFILDWEGWGLGPRGHDAATLWGHSLMVPEVADRVQQEFADHLGSRSGLLAQLLLCSNVIRLGRNKPTPGPLFEPATREAERLISTLTAQPAALTRNKCR